MKKTKKPNNLILYLISFLFMIVSVNAVQTPVDLGSSGDFAILAQSAITTTGVTTINGNIGISPAAASTITGFSLIMDSSNQYATSTLVNGQVYAADYATPTPAAMTIAIGDMGTAYTNASTRATPDFTEEGVAGDISGLVLTPGLHKWTTPVTITTNVTLDGNSSDVWIFQIAQTLDLSSNAKIILINGALPENVFWQVAGASTTLGTNSVFNGIILSATTIIMNTNATLNGRALAQTAVTLDNNTINTVTPASVLTSIDLSPNTTVILGNTIQLNITKLNANGFPMDGGVIVYTSSNTSVATVDAAGLVTSVAAGFTIINATSGAVTDSVVITIVSHAPITISIIPASNKVVNLGTAGNFVILSKTGVSTTGVTSIVGDIGVSPAAATFLTGFGLIADPSNQFSTSSLVTGNLYAANYAPPTPTAMTTAISDMEIAYTDAAGRTLPTATELGAGEIGSMTIAPGLYSWSSGVLITTDVTLSGNSSDVWIFQVAQTLDLANGKQIILSGGALPENVFWQVAGQTTLGTNSVFNGNILGKTAIVMNNGATLNGRALAQTAVTLDANIVTVVPASIAAISSPTGTESYNVTLSAVGFNGTAIDYINYTLNGVNGQINGSFGNVLISTEGNNTLTYYAVDVLGNIGVVKTIYPELNIIPAVPVVVSSGSSGGGGGGSGASYVPQVDNSYSSIFSQMEVGLHSVDVLNEEDISITNFVIKTTQDASNVRFIVTELTKKPSSVSTPQIDKIYGYIEIVHTNINNSMIESVDIQFKVLKTWITSNDVETGQIALYRYTSSWDKLETKMVSSDSKYYYFEAKSPGLSYFVIGTTQSETPVTNPVGTPTTPTTPTTSDTIDSTQEDNGVTQIINDKTNVQEVVKSDDKTSIWVISLLVLFIIVGLIIGGYYLFKKD